MGRPDLTVERLDEDPPPDDETGGGRAQQPPRTRRQNTPPPPHHKGRGPRRMSVTYKDAARVLGVKVATIRQWVWAGRFDPTDPLGSVVRILGERRRGR